MGMFLHRQGIHIRPQPNRARRLTNLQHADHTGCADGFMHLQPDIAQGRRDTGGGAILDKSKFRMLVHIPAKRHQWWNEVVNIFLLHHLIPVPIERIMPRLFCVAPVSTIRVATLALFMTFSACANTDAPYHGASSKQTISTRSIISRLGMATAR
jgi:hypothetical protein